MRTVTVSSKGQIAIPKDVREHLKIKAGTKLVIDTNASEITLRPVVTPGLDWQSFEGKYADDRVYEQIIEDRKLDREDEERRAMGMPRGR